MGELSDGNRGDLGGLSKGIRLGFTGVSTENEGDLDGISTGTRGDLHTFPNGKRGVLLLDKRGVLGNLGVLANRGVLGNLGVLGRLSNEPLLVQGCLLLFVSVIFELIPVKLSKLQCMMIAYCVACELLFSFIST